MGGVSVWCDQCGNPKKWAERNEPCDKCDSTLIHVDDADWADRDRADHDDDSDDDQESDDNGDDESSDDTEGC